MKDIDAEKLKTWLENEADMEFKKTEENANSPVLCHFHNGCRMQALDTIDFIDSLQQEQPEVFDTLAFRKGVEEGKRLMMEDAVEADVNTYTDPAGGESWAEFVVRMPTQNLGDKAKIIILPKEEEKCGTSKLRNKEAWITRAKRELEEEK